MTDTYPAMGEPPQTLLLAMEQLISGERNIGEFRDEMLNVLYEQPQTVTAIRSLVDDYARRGLIPEQIHRLLSRDIDKVTNEELPTTPTEFSFEDESTNSLNRTEPTSPQEEPLAESAPTPARVKRRAAALDIGSLLRDRFEIVGRAPGGSMGVVYKAIDRRLAEAEGGQPYVAIKVLAPGYAGHGGAMRALQQEAAKGRYLTHRNIVRFLDLDRCDGQIFLVMEWLEGRALSGILNERPGEALPKPLALKIINAVGDALAHAHKLGITHADVKPGNIMILADGTVKLLDFGIARARGDLAGKTMGFDSSFLQAATPAYASPDVLSGKAARPQDDVFSLACLAYRLLSGRRVFGDKTSLQARDASTQPERIDGLEGRLWRPLEAALSLDSERRTQTIEQFLMEFGLAPEQRDGGGGMGLGVWYAAAALIVLLALAILSPRMKQATREARTPVAVTQPAVQAQGPALREAETPPPEVAFEVTNAEFVRLPESALAPAAITLSLPATDSVVPAVFAELRLMEDAGPATIRLSRSGSLDEILRLRLTREAASEAVELMVSDSVAVDDAPILFDAGQRNFDLVVEHRGDTRVEPDYSLDFNLASVADGAVLARLSLRLLDDDRQRLAAELPPDTVGFAEPEITVRENETAARITLWRFNQRASELTVGFTVSDDTAIAGDDYLPPVQTNVEFGPGETSAVLYLPIVLDNIVEPIETFTLTLDIDNEITGVNPAVAVRILDN